MAKRPTEVTFVDFPPFLHCFFFGTAGERGQCLLNRFLPSIRLSLKAPPIPPIYCPKRRQHSGEGHKAKHREGRRWGKLNRPMPSPLALPRRRRDIWDFVGQRFPPGAFPHSLGHILLIPFPCTIHSFIPLRSWPSIALLPLHFLPMPPFFQLYSSLLCSFIPIMTPKTKWKEWRGQEVKGN